MLNKILLVCLLFSAGSSLPCRWMDRDFKQYSESALALLQTMKINSTDDIEPVDAVAFPNELYKHASKDSRKERLSFVAHVLDEIHALFEENQTHASWPETTVDDFLNIISQQANGVRRCVGKQTLNHHKKNHRKMTLYFKRLSRHVLENMEAPEGRLRESFLLLPASVPILGADEFAPDAVDKDSLQGRAEEVCIAIFTRDHRVRRHVAFLKGLE